MYTVWTSVRHQLNLKKNKADDYSIRKQNTYSPQPLAAYLANATNNEGLIDETCSLSKSLIGGSVNVCKMRALTFWLPERVFQGLFEILAQSRVNGAIYIYIYIFD